MTGFFSHVTGSIRTTFPARASEWALGLILFNWSIILSLNDDLFQTTVALAPLADFLTQGSWATVCMIGGGGRLFILAINGAWRRSPHLRGMTAFISCFFWFQISVGLFHSGTFSTGLAVYPVLFMLDAFNTIRAMGEAGRSDHLHKRMAENGTDT